LDHAEHAAQIIMQKAGNLPPGAFRERYIAAVEAVYMEILDALAAIDHERRMLRPLGEK
jgi:hypothetical protein